MSSVDAGADSTGNSVAKLSLKDMSVNNPLVGVNSAIRRVWQGRGLGVGIAQRLGIEYVLESMEIKQRDLGNSGAVLHTIRFARFWRGTVLLRFDGAYEILAQTWPLVSDAHWEKALANPRELFRIGDPTEILKDGISSLVVRRRLKLGQAQPEVICKLSHRRNLLRKAIGLLRRSRPSRNWKVAWALLENGIPTALPVAVFEKRLGPIRLAAGMITLSLSPGKELADFAKTDAASLPREAQRKLTRDLAVLIGKLHNHDFFHRDLKGRNIFIHHEQCSAPRMYFLDLDGCESDRQSYTKNVKSLGRLARASLDWPTVGRATRLRFLKTYLHDSKYSEMPWKKWWRDIDFQVGRKIRRKTRRNG